jgi:uncharacterized SAM-binding protein YcdF (DUF218 family)
VPAVDPRHERAMRSVVLPFAVAAGAFLLLLAGLLVAVREGRFDSPAARRRAVGYILVLALCCGIGASLIA